MRVREGLMPAAGVFEGAAHDALRGRGHAGFRNVIHDRGRSNARTAPRILQAESREP